ncbi:UxaA family hydrolase [Acidaminococcus massiliensis]|uniref:UxaA family hydrolase n=1 Tax=Acidaminococcus massiliensis TaxID=1852375 RepID=UPI0026DCDFBD|nr:UxaA family hydrolase [Acidaminococcus massiliensis]
MERTFMGYQRADGSVGTRNYLVILPSVFCANSTVQKIAAQIPGAVPMTHCVGCSQVGLDLELTARTLKAMGCHPNAGAVIVVGLGCERFDPEELYQAVKATGKPVAKFVIQEEGGPTKTVEKAVAVGKKFAAILAQQQRVPCPLSALMVGTKCGGTDATSGLASNPAVGNMVDRLVDAGGSAILSELNELLGTEKFLAKRAVNAQVAQKIYDAVYEIEDVLRGGLDFSLPENRNHLISRGNFAGGVSSVVEKALGGVHKGGTRPIQDVLPYAIPPQKGQYGLFLMDYESQDGEVVTGEIGCGSQLIAFTTGRGHATGHPLVPVLKVTGNYKTYAAMTECFDFDASPIISQGTSIEDEGERLLDLVIQVASGEQTAAEKLGGTELFCVARRHGYHKKDPAELRKHEKEVGNC